MNSRIKKIREENKLSQEEFGKRIGVGRSSISKLESGENNPSDQTILLICNTFNVNEDWLRTGEGEMFKPLSRSETIAKFAGELMKDEDDSFRRQLVEALAQLDEKEWEVLAGIAKKLTKKDQAEN